MLMTAPATRSAPSLAAASRDTRCQESLPPRLKVMPTQEESILATPFQTVGFHLQCFA